MWFYTVPLYPIWFYTVPLYTIGFYTVPLYPIWFYTVPLYPIWFYTGGVGSHHAELRLELNLQTLQGAPGLGELAPAGLHHQGAGSHLAVEVGGLEVKRIIRNIVKRIN